MAKTERRPLQVRPVVGVVAWITDGGNGGFDWYADPQLADKAHAENLPLAEAGELRAALRFDYTPETSKAGEITDEIDGLGDRRWFFLHAQYAVQTGAWTPFRPCADGGTCPQDDPDGIHECGGRLYESLHTECRGDPDAECGCEDDGARYLCARCDRDQLVELGALEDSAALPQLGKVR